MFCTSGRKIPIFTLMLILLALVNPLSGVNTRQSQSGVVRSGDTPLTGAKVRLWRTSKHRRDARVLGKTQSDALGRFTIHFKQPKDSQAVLYLIAEGGRLADLNGGLPSKKSPVRLATVLGQAGYQHNIVINERTTVATAYAMAQFIKGRRIGGTYPGLQNAAATVRNLVELRTGKVGEVLNTPPNGELTTTRQAFNSLANMVAGCVQDHGVCTTLFAETTTPTGKTPRNTLQAMVNIAHYPGQNVQELLDLALANTTYHPALPNDFLISPLFNAWTLALRYNGDGPLGQELDGPGNIAFDSHGNAWVNNNYEFSLSPEPFPYVCGSTKVLKFTPTGGTAPGAPYGGVDGPDSGRNAGGLYGAGFGIGLDPQENVWISSFGFQGENCPYDATSLYVSVAKFGPDGKTLSSPDGDPAKDQPGGFQGQQTRPDRRISAPQGIVSDRKGNIWIANCANNTVTMFPEGNSELSRNFPTVGLQKPFDIAIDHRGHAWITGNESGTVLALDVNGDRVTPPIKGFKLPMGIATDSRGNLWVADAGVSNPPCPALGGAPAILPEPGLDLDGQNNIRAGVGLIHQRGNNPTVTIFDKLGGQRDGLRWPWGIAIDGNDNVWIANFAGQRVMQLCGRKRSTCPPGVKTGDPISPDSGYASDALARNTAVEIDPSGNVWLTNNWILDGFTSANPGGHELVVFIGLAAPVKTPLIGPVRRPR